MIKGLSERRRLPRLGKIKLGVTETAANGKTYPKATDYLVCPPEVQAVYGERPKELPVMFPTDNPDVLFPQELKAYRQSGLFCAGDGERARRWGPGPDGKTTLVERACPCELLEQGKCKPTATLHLLLPDVPGIGVWTITTSSQRSIIELNTAFEQMLATFGGLRGIPFTLSLEVEQGQRPGEGGQMVRQELHVLHLTTAYTLRQIVEWRQRAGKPVEALMPAPDEDENLPTGQNGGDHGGGGVVANGSADPGSPVLGPAVDAAPEPRTPSPAPTTTGPSGSAPGDPRGSLRPGETEEWDVSMAYRAAAKCGIAAELYARWLVAHYGHDADNVTTEDLTAERRRFEACQTEGERMLVKAEVVKTVNAALGNKRR